MLSVVVFPSGLNTSVTFNEKLHLGTTYFDTSLQHRLDYIRNQ